MASPTVALWCLLAAAVMPYFVVAIAKSSKAYDNEDPRNMAGFQTPLRRRAHGAHQNCFEAFGLFAMAVLVALIERGAGDTEWSYRFVGFVSAGLYRDVSFRPRALADGELVCRIIHQYWDFFNRRSSLVSGSAG